VDRQPGRRRDGDPGPDALGGLVGRLAADPAGRPEAILFADGRIGLHQLRLGGGGGAYLDPAGRVVARWDSVWDRPELWLFELHRRLLAGATGETVAGLAALAGLGFVISGVALWWPTRRTFRPRAVPARLTRPAILRHHRDLGLLLAPLLLLSFLTGAMLALKPVADLLISPWSSPAERRAALAPPVAAGGPLSPRLDWRTLLGEARRRFPDAEFRSLALPRRPGDLIQLRLRQPAEWLPNGRTTLWFDPADGRLVEARDARALPSGVQLFNAVYPVHAGRVGGIAWRLAVTLAGVGLALLGSLAVWTFWFARPARRGGDGS
jgi:uncharacterized iron-regulated membrane protein